MTIPLIVRIGALVFATTAFYTYVGQMVPQKEVQPPQATALGADMTPADMVKVGREIMAGKGICLTCHTIGQTGALRFPDLAGIGAQAKNRVPGMSDVEYLAQSMYEPAAYVVPGFPPAMPPVNQPPIGLTDQEILSVIAALQALGGTPTVTLKTTHRYYNGTAAPGGTQPPAAPPGQTGPGEAQSPSAPSKGAQRRPAISIADVVTLASARAPAVLRSGGGAAGNESSALVVPHSGPGAPQARAAGASAKAGVERGDGGPWNDGDTGPRRASFARWGEDEGLGAAKPRGLPGAVAR